MCIAAVQGGGGVGVIVSELSELGGGYEDSHPTGQRHQMLEQVRSTAFGR
jgi:hypothetical protein